MTARSGNASWDREPEARSGTISDGLARARGAADHHYLAVVAAEIHRLALGLGAPPAPRPQEFRNGG
jgi:hypothetical protein